MISPIWTALKLVLSINDITILLIAKPAGIVLYNMSLIGHVRYINILKWLRGFRVKIVNFLSFFCLSILKRDLDTKKTTPNIEVCPESLGAMLEYWYIERDLLGLTHLKNIGSNFFNYISTCIESVIYNALESSLFATFYRDFVHGRFCFV